MKLLVVSEGDHELGKHDVRGALLILSERLLDRDLEIISEKVSSTLVARHMLKGKGGGYTKRVIAWMAYARRAGFDALILVVDQDGDQERERQLNDAQSDDRIAFPRAIGVAIKRFDAWMLADEKALTRVLGVTVNRQPNPETLGDPKQTCADLRDDHGADISQTEMYSHVAKIADLATLKNRCPKGFGVFASRVRQL